MQVKKVYEFDLYEDTWSGAQEKMRALTDDLRNALENILDNDTEGLFGNEIPDVGEVNDFLWFDDDTYADWLGFSSADVMWEYCNLVNRGIDEDDLYYDNAREELTTKDLIQDEFELYQSENPDWEEYYTDWEEYAEDNYTKFEI